MIGDMEEEFDSKMKGDDHGEEEEEKFYSFNSPSKHHQKSTNHNMTNDSNFFSESGKRDRNICHFLSFIFIHEIGRGVVESTSDQF